MHIVYSALKENCSQSRLLKNEKQSVPGLLTKRIAHEQVCAKYKDEIIAIRKYMPHWQPAFFQL